MHQFANRFNFTEKELIEISNKEIIRSCITLIQEKKYSHFSQKQFLGAIKKFYSECFEGVLTCPLYILQEARESCQIFYRLMK
jgi:hypothetical protein